MERDPVRTTGRPLRRDPDRRAARRPARPRARDPHPAPARVPPPPDELWVDVGYRRAEDPVEQSDRSIRFKWRRAIEPRKRSPAPEAVELRTRRAVGATSEAARRARKLLFQTALWEQDRLANQPVAKAAAWIETTFPGAISARRLRTAHGTFGYLRLWTFDVEHSARFTEEVARILRNLPRKGLIIDLRSNPGGVIDTTERLLQLFTRQPIQPIRFALRATPAMAALAEADANGADLRTGPEPSAPPSIGEEFSQHLPISDPERCNGHRRGRITGRRRRGQCQHVLVRRHLRGGDR